MDEVKKYQEEMQQIIEGTYQHGLEQGMQEMLEILKELPEDDSIWDVIYNFKNKK